jgi:hypothetical protein
VASITGQLEGVCGAGGAGAIGGRIAMPFAKTEACLSDVQSTGLCEEQLSTVSASLRLGSVGEQLGQVQASSAIAGGAGLLEQRECTGHVAWHTAADLVHHAQRTTG